jgi:hypothetical protein
MMVSGMYAIFTCEVDRQLSTDMLKIKLEAFINVFTDALTLESGTVRL